MTAGLWLKLAGYLTWLVCGIPGAVEIATGDLSRPRAIAWGIAFPLFGVALALCSEHVTRRRVARLAALAVQSIAGLTLVWAIGDGLAAATLVVVAAQLHSALDTRGMLAWVTIQSLALAALFWRMDGPLAAVVAGGAFAGFQMFAIATSWLAHSESLARQALGRSNAELMATRELLAENSRVAERLRIARDLHDTLGHHLTALSIQLEVASRLTEGQAAGHIREAHAVARLLLGDVRSSVSALREGSRVDLSQALRALSSTPGALSIHMEIPERLDLDSGAQADALLRCVQEIITNTARHASADHLWITIAQRPDGIDLHTRDDGRGIPEVRWGNGLRGIRERFEEYAGRVEFESTSGRGFQVRGFMPRPEHA
jgi:signal transduction histidine kinase